MTLYRENSKDYTNNVNGGGGGGLVTKWCLTLVIPRTIIRQAPLSMGFSRQEYWSGLPLPSPVDLPNPGIKSTGPAAPALLVDSLPLVPPGYFCHPIKKPHTQSSNFLCLTFTSSWESLIYVWYL